MKLFTSGSLYTLKQFVLFAALFCGITYTASARPVLTGVTPPSATSVCAGDSATFISSDSLISGTIQWQLSTDSGATFNDISGATDSIYSFPSFAFQNGFLYRAVFLGILTSDTSAPALLTVYTPGIDSITTSICPGDSFVIGTKAFYTNGTFSDTLVGASVHGCDSIVTLNLTIYSPATDTITTSICPGDSFVIGTKAFYSNGTFSDTLLGASAHGCDSIVTLNLTIYSPATDTITTTICHGDSFVVGTKAFYSTGTFSDTLLGASAHGCDSIVTLHLTVRAAVTKNITKTICQGSSYTAGGQTYSSTGTYIDTLIGASVHGCDSVVTLHLTVDTLIYPSVSISASTSDTICQNTVVNLSAIGINGGNTPDYQWKRNGINVGNSQTYIANPILNGDVFTCVLTSTATCATPVKDTSNAITFTVNAYPTVMISSSGGTTTCAGDSVILTASGGDHYLWSTGATTASVYSSGGTYTVTATNGYGCTAGSTPLHITAGTALVDSITQVGDTLISGPSQFYQWYQNDSIIGGAIGSTYVPAHTGSYQVAVIDSFGCKAYSSVIYILEAGISTLAADPAISIYPNPNAGIFTIDCGDEALHTATISDALGRVILDHVTIIHQQQLDLHTLTDGIYYLHIADSKNDKTIKFSIAR